MIQLTAEETARFAQWCDERAAGDYAEMLARLPGPLGAAVRKAIPQDQAALQRAAFILRQIDTTTVEGANYHGPVKGETPAEEMRRRWMQLPIDEQVAVLLCREYEEEAAYHLTLLTDRVRAFFRHAGGAAAVRRALSWACPCCDTAWLDGEEPRPMGIGQPVCDQCPDVNLVAPVRMPG